MRLMYVLKKLYKLFGGHVFYGQIALADFASTTRLSAIR